MTNAKCNLKITSPLILLTRLVHYLFIWCLYPNYLVFLIIIIISISLFVYPCSFLPPSGVDKDAITKRYKCLSTNLSTNPDPEDKKVRREEEEVMEEEEEEG